MAGSGRDDVVPELLLVADRLAIDDAVGDHRREVASGVRLAVGGDAVEVRHEVGHRLDDAGQHVVVALEVVVLGAEQLLGELEHARVVGLG